MVHRSRYFLLNAADNGGITGWSTAQTVGLIFVGYGGPPPDPGELLVGEGNLNW
jgi:hypothetical protein